MIWPVRDLVILGAVANHFAAAAAEKALRGRTELAARWQSHGRRFLIESKHVSVHES